MAERFKIGEAPWETAQAPQAMPVAQGAPVAAPPGAFPVGQAPWEVKDSIVNERTPHVSGIDRAVYKNLAASPEAGFNYLQKKYPNLEFKKDPDGDIITKAKNEPTWKPIDPKGFDPEDITDVGSDVVTGIGTGLATAAGGLAGLAAGPGGSLALGSGAGAFAGGGLEALRQAIGAGVMGDAKNFDPTQIGIAGVSGAVSPLLFGTGAAGAKLGEAAVKQGMGQAAAASAQRGAFGRLWDAAGAPIARKIGAIATGVDAGVIKKAGEILPDIQMAQNKPELIVNKLEEGRTQIIDGIRGALDEAGTKMGQITSGLDAAGEQIPTANILEPVRKLKTLLESKGIQSEERKGLISKLQGMLDGNFSVKPKSELQGFEGIALPEGLIAPEAVKGEIPKTVSATTANEMYWTLKDLAEQSGTNFGNLGTTKGSVHGLSQSDARMSRAFLDSMGKAKESIKTLADRVDPALGKEYRDLHGTYSQLKGWQDDFFKGTKDEQALARFVKQDNATARVAKDKISQLTGRDINDLGTEIQALELFSRPTWDARSSNAVTSTSRTVPLALAGGAAGYYLGQKTDSSPFLAAALGGMLGAKAGSPAMIRKALEATGATRRWLPMPANATTNILSNMNRTEK